MDDGIGAIVYDLYFEGDIIYAATDKGLFRAIDENLEWDKIEIEGPGNDTILSDKVYTTYKNKISDFISFLWVGTPDGKAYSNDDGITWFVDRYLNSTSQTDNDIGLSVFPNPAQENIIIEIENLIDENIQVTLFNILGSEIQDLFNGNVASNHQTIEANLSSLEKGIYFIRASSNKDIIMTDKLILNK